MLDVNEIKKILPHRYPFLMVDRIVELEVGKRAVGIKNVTVNEEFFNGHFPGNPIMPGVLILEAMAQTAGILSIKTSGAENVNVFFMSIDKAKFRKPVLPGDQLVIEVDIVRLRGKVTKCACRALVEDKLVAEAELLAMMVEVEG